MQSFILLLPKSALLVSAALLRPSAPAVCVVRTQAAVMGFDEDKFVFQPEPSVCILQRRRHFYAKKLNGG